MTRRKIGTKRVVASGACVGAMVAIVACTSSERTNPQDPQGPREAIITFSPSCGKAGDEVKVLVRGMRGSAEHPCVGFVPRFHPGVPAESSREETAATTDCSYVVNVPGGAVTGTISLLLTETEELVSKDVFTIPCPDPGPGVDPGNPEGGAPEGGAAEGGVACKPKGTASGPPDVTVSEAAQCANGTVHVTGTNTGTDMCLTIGSVTFPTLPGDVRRAKIPYGIAPGTYQMTIEGPGGSTQKEFTITPGEAPEITGISPMTASPGALVTLTGTGFMGLTEVTVIHFTSRTGPPDQVVNAPATVDRAGKSLTFNLPANIAAGYARVQTEKPSCGFDEVPLTVNF